MLRDKMATMQYELMENYGVAKRDEFPYGEEADQYWKDFVDGLMAEVKYYDYDVELNTKYRPKGIISPEDAFLFMDKLIPSKENAFLFRNNPYIRRNDL